MSIIYTRSSRSDLREIARYYANLNRAYAIRITSAIREQCRQLSTSPGIGRIRDELSEGMRSFVVRPYVIFYREVEEGVAILRVIHGRRDIRPEMFTD